MYICTHIYTHIFPCIRFLHTLRHLTLAHLERAQPRQTLTARLVCIFRFIKGCLQKKALSRKGPHVAVCCSMLQCDTRRRCAGKKAGVAVCCSVTKPGCFKKNLVLQCIAASCSAMQYMAVCCNVTKADCVEKDPELK